MNVAEKLKFWLWTYLERVAGLPPGYLTGPQPPHPLDAHPPPSSAKAPQVYERVDVAGRPLDPKRVLGGR